MQSGECLNVFPHPTMPHKIGSSLEKRRLQKNIKMKRDRPGSILESLLADQYVFMSLLLLFRSKLSPANQIQREFITIQIPFELRTETRDSEQVWEREKLTSSSFCKTGRSIFVLVSCYPRNDWNFFPSSSWRLFHMSGNVSACKKGFCHKYKHAANFRSTSFLTRTMFLTKRQEICFQPLCSGVYK